MAKRRRVTENRSKQSIEKYLEEIGNYSPLPPEEEIRLARRIRKGDEEALDKLVKANLRFVISVAKEYQGQGLPLQDLISEGNLGLIKAAQRFDETRGFKFISYAVWWIRQSILQALAEQSRVVRLPLNRVGAINKVGRALEQLEKEYGREPSMQELAEKMEMTAYEVADVLKTSARHLSLDEPFNEEDGNSLLDVIESDRYDPPDAGLMRESLRQEIEKVLSTLKPREAEIIKLYFGLDGDRPLTLEEIGEYFQLTRERVRQIKDKALRRLRHRS
ncbi:MAG: sigma-70 family RNA polymerase sigma factor, partial [Calditrichaeota bacterium]|nr:sigma-70 family RNA polymerase sigma factor [Calditrichota bacterium]